MKSGSTCMTKTTKLEHRKNSLCFATNTYATRSRPPNRFETSSAHSLYLSEIGICSRTALPMFDFQPPEIDFR